MTGQTSGYKWRKLYANIIGVAIWALPAPILARIMIDETGNADPVAALILGGIWLFIWPFVCVIGASKLNSYMMEKTGTNAELINAFLRGEYDYMIPDKMKTQEGRVRLYKILKKGMATSMEGAILMAKKKNIDRKIGRVALIGAAAAMKAGNDMTDRFWNDFGDAVENGIASLPEYFKVPDAPVTVDNTWRITQEKNKAVWMETQAANAKFANPGTYSTKRKGELAKQQRIKANNMWKQKY